jgi:hypothetical protein
MRRVLVECSEKTRKFLKMEAAAREMKMSDLLDELINASRKAIPKCIQESKVNLSNGITSTRR